MHHTVLQFSYMFIFSSMFIIFIASSFWIAMLQCIVIVCNSLNNFLIVTIKKRLIVFLGFYKRPFASFLFCKTVLQKIRVLLISRLRICDFAFFLNVTFTCLTDGD